MLYLNRGIQNDLASAAIEPVSKLNVFDRRAAKRGIEAAMSTEHTQTG